MKVTSPNQQHKSQSPSHANSQWHHKQRGELISPAEWHWSAWVILFSALIIGMGLGFFTARKMYERDELVRSQQISQEAQKNELGDKIGSLNEDLARREKFQQNYRAYQQQDIEKIATEKFEDKLTEFEADRLNQIQLLHSQAEEALIQGNWSDPTSCAMQFYRRILVLDPNDEQANESIDLIAQRFRAKSKESTADENYEQAFRFALFSFEAIPSAQANELLAKTSEDLAIFRLSERAQSEELVVLTNNAEELAAQGSASIEDLQQSLDGLRKFRAELGLPYSPDWTDEVASSIRERAQGILDNDPADESALVLLQLATAFDAKVIEVELPERATTPVTASESDRLRGGVPNVIADVPETPSPTATNQSASENNLDNDASDIRANASNISPDAGSWESAYQHYVRSNYVTASSQFAELAEQGDDRSKFYLAMMYADGQGVAANRVRAQQLLSQSAPAIRRGLDLGERWAQFAQGVMYDRGWLVAQNRQRALDLYAEAALRADPIAQYQLSQLMAQTSTELVANQTSVQWRDRAARNGLVR